MARHPESLMQQSLVQRCAHHPVLRHVYAIPNGGYRSRIEAAIMKGEGVKPGMPDLHLPVAAGPFHSLYVELKVGTNKPSPEQEERLAELQALGHAVAVVWDDWQLALAHMEAYLAGQAETGVRIKPVRTKRANATLTRHR